MISEQITRVLRIAPFLLCAWVMLCLSSAITLERAFWFQILYFSFLALPLFRPVWAVGALLILIPWLGGSQPGYAYITLFTACFRGHFRSFVKPYKGWLVRSSASAVLD